MNYKNTIKNSSVVLDSDGACTIDCPGCNFGVSERKNTNKLSIEELKKRIDFTSENLNTGYSLILLPGNVLLEYNTKEIEEILIYASSKAKVVQWELEKIDERILDIFNSDLILELLDSQKVFLNIGYIDGNLELLKKIFNELAKIGGKNIKDILINKGLYDNFENKNIEEKFRLLKGFREKGEILPNPIDLLKFTVHFNKDKKGELKEFIDFLGINVDLNNFLQLEKYGGDINYDIFSAGLLFTVHSTMNQKIDSNGNNIWDITHKKGYESCILLDNDFEWSIGGDKEGTILPHCNPCINKISFGNMESSESDIELSFKKHRDKIKSILIKNKYTKDFDQSELCKTCLDGEEEELKILDYLKYIVRQQVFMFKESVSNLIGK